MKPMELEAKPVEQENEVPIAGDVIGDTAYSERFVLKIMLKFANLDTLKDEVHEKSFEDDLCMLWDMTAERDVVLFLQKHDVLKLFHFALPAIENARIIEVIVGIIGNMCCEKEVVATLLIMDSFITALLEYMKSDDSLILVQVLRFVSACLFVVEAEDIEFWMKKFEDAEYASSLHFILKNSSNKDLLLAALENYNTLSSNCNKEATRMLYFKQFVTSEAIVSLSTGFAEIVDKEQYSDNDELERILAITLQILLNLVGFDKSLDTYIDNIDDILKVIGEIMHHYENKFVNTREIDLDFVDILDSTQTIVKIMQLSEKSDLDKFFEPSYNIWKALNLYDTNKNGNTDSKNTEQNDFEDDNKEIGELTTKIKSSLSLLMCLYLAKCSEDNLLKALDEISSNYDEILSSVQEEETKSLVYKRAQNYRTRLKENVDS